MIFRLDYRRYALPLRVPLRTSRGLWPVREGIIVRLTDGDGRVGYGEVAPIPWFGTETTDAAERVLRQIGSDLNEETFAAIPLENGCTRSALSSALGAWDDQGVGAAHFGARRPGAAFDQQSRARADSELSRAEQDDASTSAVKKVSAPIALPVAALLPAGRAALTEIDARVELGFRVFKWKVGVGDPADELGLMDDLLGRMPSGSKLRLDANGAWDRRRTERWLERCADRPIDHVEQPIAPDARGAYDLLLGLANDFPTPLALDESLVGQRDVDRWLAAGWPGVFVIKPSLLADAGKALDTLARAKAQVVFSSALETGVGARAALAWAFRWPLPARALGFGVWPLFQEADFDGPFAAPFLRWSDVERINPEEIWNRLNRRTTETG